MKVYSFRKKIFGGEFLTIMRFGDTSGGEKIPAADRNKIMHIALPLGTNIVLMATDALDSMGQKPIAGNNFSISISSESKNEADTFFKSLSAGEK